MVLDWGKFYKSRELPPSGSPIPMPARNHHKAHPPANKDDEIPIDQVAKTVIPPRGTYLLASSGRSDAAAGCEGHFDLITEDGTIVAKVNFESPWGTRNVVFHADSPDSGWIASVSGFDPKRSHVGRVTLKIARVPA